MYFYPQTLKSGYGPAATNFNLRFFKKRLTAWENLKTRLQYQLPSLHCTVIGFALDWESHKSIKHEGIRAEKRLGGLY